MVIVIAGNDKGKTGEVLGRSQEEQGAGRGREHALDAHQADAAEPPRASACEEFVPIHASNVMLLRSRRAGKGTRKRPKE